ncbi:hypothetical protein BSLA_03f1441 [Burkholderia stabilis]|nr:hypothetical protein BSLA_03f1441 [Burkholderia stabilis]
MNPGREFRHRRVAGDLRVHHACRDPASVEFAWQYSLLSTADGS